MNYKCLNKNEFVSGNYALVPLRENDLLPIMHWRNAQIDVLRQKQELTEEQQKAYYHNHILPAYNTDFPKQILFSFLQNGQCIGYGGLTNIDWESRRAEMSFLLDNNLISDPILYEQLFSIYISLLKKVVFDEMSFNRLFTETYDIRETHVKTLQKNGFIFEGRMREHVLIAGKYTDSLIHGINRSDYGNER